jgi:hypothetical protein
MNPTQHVEEKLLDYSYGELAPEEAKTVEGHLRTCSRCADSLKTMSRVRRTMSQLPIVPAPAKGLHSLLAYAEQAARRARPRPNPQSAWVRWLAPVAGFAALSVVLVVSTQVLKTGGQPRTERENSAGLEKPAPEATNAGKDDEPEPSSFRRAITSPPPPAADRKHKAKMVAAPKSLRQDEAKEGAGHDSAGSGDIAEREVTGDEAGVEGGVPGGVVGGVLGGPLKPEAASKKQRSASELAPAGASGLGEGRQASAGSALPQAAPAPSRVSPPSTSFNYQAAEARKLADPEREAAQLQEALASGARGQERARILRRLCDVLEALKREAEADSACNAVIREFPDSEDAKAAAERLKLRASKAKR